MSKQAVVFAVCKGVTLHTTSSGKHVVRLALAPICAPAGDVDMTKSLVTAYGTSGSAAVAVDRLIYLMGDKTAQAFLHWAGSGPEEVRDRIEAACLNRCVWLCAEHHTPEKRFTNFKPLSPEEAGAALRGGHL